MINWRHTFLHEYHSRRTSSDSRRASKEEPGELYHETFWNKDLWEDPKTQDAKYPTLQ
jgi:hypothetical protein